MFKSRFVNVYQDTVKLPSGKVVSDYTLIEKPNYVEIVATDEKNRIITIKEYRHGSGAIEIGLPAGHIESGESAINAAKRELLEETGFAGYSFKRVGILSEYSSKDMHSVHVIRVLGVYRKGRQHLDENESIKVELISIENLRSLILKNKFRNSGSLAALAICGILS